MATKRPEFITLLRTIRDDYYPDMTQWYDEVKVMHGQVNIWHDNVEQMHEARRIGSEQPGWFPR